MNKIFTALFMLILSLESINAQSQTTQTQLTAPKPEQNQRQNRWTTIGPYLAKDSVTKGPYTLIFINKDTAFQQSGATVKKRMIDAFFTVYPKEVDRFNPQAARKVTFIIDPAYKGVAATSGTIIRYSPKWMLERSEDIDVVTHEAFHVVQNYGRGSGPGWLTEGITDYVRYKYGVNNENAKWSLTAFNSSQSYTNSYRITGRFLAWLEKNIRPTIVNELDNALRTHTYNPEIWAKLTGKTVDELWQTYAQNPTL